MKIVCFPHDEIEQAMLVAEFELAKTPYFIQSQYFGGLYPGLQIPSYNERAIRVPENDMDLAVELVEQFRAHYRHRSDQLTFQSTCRVWLEGLILGWSVPANRKIETVNEPKDFD